MNVADAMYERGRSEKRQGTCYTVFGVWPIPVAGTQAQIGPATVNVGTRDSHRWHLRIKPNITHNKSTGIAAGAFGGSPDGRIIEPLERLSKGRRIH